MKSELLKNLDRTVDLIASLEKLFSALPNNLHFDSLAGCCEDVGLIQLHWTGAENDYSTREAEAKMLARAWGGTWQRHDDGSWKGNRTVEGCRMICGQKLILHNVEPKIRGAAIDLGSSAPSA